MPLIYIMRSWNNLQNVLIIVMCRSTNYPLRHYYDLTSQYTNSIGCHISLEFLQTIHLAEKVDSDIISLRQYEINRILSPESIESDSIKPDLGRQKGFNRIIAKKPHR